MANIQLTFAPTASSIENFLASATFAAESLTISNHGQIAALTLPGGWHEDQSVQRINIGSRSSRQFYPTEAPEVRFNLYYRGYPLSAADGQKFAAVLKKDAHILSLAEIDALSAVLGERANSRAFSLLSLRTADIAGKRVLIVEGRYKQLQMDIFEVFVDADGSGQAVQEIYLLAPKEKYALFLNTIKKAINQISWK